MGYEDAPATKMIATNCAICRRPLVDSLSVETGMGPDCRSKHGFSGKRAPNVNDDDRKKANRIVYSIALGLPQEHLAAAIADLRTMGFDTLANVLEDRNVAVHIEGHDIAHIIVRAEFNEQANADSAWRTIPGRRFDWELKANIIPATDASRRALWNLLRKYYPGQLMKSEKGLTAIPGGEAS
jgi:hypothetical protein